MKLNYLKDCAKGESVVKVYENLTIALDRRCQLMVNFCLEIKAHQTLKVLNYYNYLSTLTNY